MIVSSLADEPDSMRIRAWFADSADRAFHISEWSVTEFSSAVSLKRRVGTLSAEHHVNILRTWRQLRAFSLTMLPVMSRHFEAAARIADRHDLSIRAGDALHLAIARDDGLRLVTLDRTMTAACPALDIAVLVP